MTLRHLTEDDLAQLIRQRDRDPIEAIKVRNCKVVITKQAGTSSPYRSKWETQFAYELVLRQRTNLIRGWAYEDMTLKLAAKKYHRPDFLIWHLDGSIELAAVKGHHANLRDSLTHLAWAAQQRPWFLFTINRRDGDRWVSEVVRP